MFEHSLIDLEAQRQPKSRRWISLPVAIALHLVILGSVAFAGIWDVAEIAEPDVNLIFVSIAPPPPMVISKLGGGNEPKPEQKQPEKLPVEEPVKREIVQPLEKDIPELPGKADVQNDVLSDLPAGPGDPEGHPDGHIDGHKDGVLDGVPDGDLNAKDSGLPPGGGGGGGVQDDVPVRLTASMTKPIPIHRVSPRYTETARRAGVQGVVITEAVIDEQGRVTNVRVLRGLPMGLTEAAIEAVQQWRFKPAMTSNGKPVKVFFSCTVDFRIQR
jgi:protein TonB